jgi:hypothetical protein
MCVAYHFDMLVWFGLILVWVDNNKINSVILLVSFFLGGEEHIGCTNSQEAGDDEDLIVRPHTPAKV